MDDVNAVCLLHIQTEVKSSSIPHVPLASENSELVVGIRPPSYVYRSVLTLASA